MWLSKNSLLTIIFVFILLAWCSHLFASDEPFTYPSNWGGTGLMEIPTARVMRENSFRIGGAQIEPYRHYYGAISPLKGLEIDGRITEILDVPSGLENQKNHKDKVIDFKYQFLSEGKFMPALAIGVMDPGGTRLYPSQYIVASKQLYPFDFTLGIGNGRFGNKPIGGTGSGIGLEILRKPREWLEDSQFFGGVQFAYSEKLALMLEYSPVKYHIQINDPAQPKYFREPVSSEFNFGIRYKPAKWSEIAISYQRGEKFGVNFSAAFDIGNPIIPLYDRIYQETPYDTANSVDDRITKSLYHSGFSDIGVHMEGSEIWIEAQNEKYFYNIRAIGIILNVLVGMLPEDIHIIQIILKENGIPVVKIKTTREDLLELYADKMTFSEFFNLAQFQTDLGGSIHAKGKYTKQIKYGYKPSLETFLNDPSGFFKYRLGVSGWISYHPWEGGSFVTGIAAYPLNNMSTTNEPLSIPVRSDHIRYKDKSISLDRLMFDQIKKLTPHIYGKLSAGLLEVQYAGIDAEIAMPVLNGRLYLGLSGSAVKKRDENNPFKLKDNPVKDSFMTAFFNSRLNVPELGTSIEIKAGRFLAGDNGARLTVSRNIKGVKIWAWYSYTDTSKFNDNFNRGYHDKGIGISIPLRLFIGSDSRTEYTYSLSPWSRDTGQDINHFNSLFDFIGRNIKIFIDKDRKMLYK